MPEPTRLEPYWWSIAELHNPRPAGNLPKECDVLIVGAGLTGLSAARTIAKAGQSVVCIDAGTPGIGASSRNGGMVGGGHRLSLSDMTIKFGKDLSKRLLQEAHQSSNQFVANVIKESDIDCDYQPCGRFRAFSKDSEFEAEEKSLDELRKAIGLQAHMVNPSDSSSEVNTEIYRGGVVFESHGGLNPAKWTQGLCHTAIDHGAIVLSNTEASTVEKSKDYFKVTTNRGAIKAKQLLMATNGYTKKKVSTLRNRILPIPSFIVATEKLGADTVKSLFPNGRMITETRLKHCYYRPSPDGERIVFGARAGLTEISEAEAQKNLRNLIAEIFPHLKDVGFSHSWRGNTGFTFNFLPSVGQINGVWHAMGYSGNGNTMAPYLGNKVALQMLGDEAGATAFSETEFPKPWWYQGHPWFLPAVNLKLKIQDRLSNSG